MKMHNSIRPFSTLLAAGMLTLVIGCSSGKKNVAVDDNGVPNAPAADENNALLGIGDSDSGKALGLQTAHFPYDSFLLSEETKSVLKENASILKSKPRVKIQIEGHCDQRGGIQYNIALGEKRANSVRSYMEDLGIPSARMTIISFGKEKLIDSDISDEAYARNRRANFVVTSH